MEPIWTDPVTGLEWGPTAPNQMAWQAAMDWCAKQGDGWRLPTIDELFSIVDYSRYEPAIVEPLRAGTVSSYYWSSTTYAVYPSSAWYVSFHNGNVSYLGKTFSYYVRAVRGGSAVTS